MIYSPITPSVFPYSICPFHPSSFVTEAPFRILQSIEGVCRAKLQKLVNTQLLSACEFQHSRYHHSKSKLCYRLSLNAAESEEPSSLVTLPFTHIHSRSVHDRNSQFFGIGNINLVHSGTLLGDVSQFPALH